MGLGSTGELPVLGQISVLEVLVLGAGWFWLCETGPPKSARVYTAELGSHPVCAQ